MGTRPNFSDEPWGPVTADDYPSADAYCHACLIDLNEKGAPKARGLCKLPVREPGGALNRNAVHAAAAVLAGARGGVQAPPDAKHKAARAVRGLYADLGEECPPSVIQMAS